MLVLNVPSPELEFVSDALWRAGVVAIEERPLGSKEVALFSTSEEVELWTSVGENITDVAQALANEGITCPWRVEQIDRAITDTWRQHAECIQVTEEVMICPSWKKSSLDSEKRVIFIDPHDMFGHGNHPTTQLALRLALGHCERRSNVVDVGCGSGVLAVALSVLRETKCRAFDIHPSTASVVLSNARLNDCHIQVEEGFADIQSGWADVVLANILAPVLIDLAVDIERICQRGAVIVLAGLRSDQGERVLSAYSGWRVVDEEECDGWLGLVLMRESVSS